MTIGALLIRADADAVIGTGHLMRCLALAQAWQAHGGRVTVAAASMPESLRRRLHDEGMAVLPILGEPGSHDDLLQTVEAAQGAAWAVIDGYQFSAEFVVGLRQAGLPVLLIDDEGRMAHYDADIVLNQNLHAGPALYERRAPHTRLLLGGRYALLRRDLRRWRRSGTRPSGSGRRVLVTMGGADPGNLTSMVLGALQQFAELEVTVLVGAANPHLETIARDAARGPFPVQVRQNETQVGTWMAWADLAVAAAGSTAWELAYLGTPMLLLVTAPNQRAVAERLAAAGPAQVVAGPPTEARLAKAIGGLLGDAERRSAMATLGQRLIDGSGASRVVSALLGWPLTLRPVTDSDCRLVWTWANAPEVRAVSFTTAEIPWEDHQRWFAGMLQKAASLWFIAEDGTGQPVGQVRFVVEDAEAVVSVVIDGRQRGQGLGTTLIAAGTGELFAATDVRLIRAYVKPTNSASCRAFLKAGYRLVGQVDYRGQPALEMQRQKGG